ncbi:four-carbon acid sugar kinase family protein [Mesorhizobium sp. CN2-181]|uniref:four-carbon acid sugar kinase family protein n=1 Tax=Mesorhizobium yinganensis TaxID=3157707 RepID=UPI0032B7BA5C
MSERLLLSYYGDDLTGSTDVMEALSLGGVPTVLFTKIPDAGLLARFGNCRAMGLAGTSRSEPPAWMDANLTPAFGWLKTLGSTVTHYKVCSTFDSSPTIGSIGRAIEIGRGVFGRAGVPLVVGAPQLKRYTAFGNLFAAYRCEIFRIDRHPVMSRHPVTPMQEADLLRHLGKQTDLPSRLIDLVALAQPDAADRIEAALDKPGILLLDVADAYTQKAAGAALWRAARRSGFMVGSSGVEYALIEAWKADGTVSGTALFPEPGPVDRLAVVSGSVSPTTERQIQHAGSDGFQTIPVDPIDLLFMGEQATDRAVAAGLAALSSGRSALLYTALGPEADRGAEIDRDEGARNRIGLALGDILRQLVVRQKLKRAVIAGGDTSSHALGQLGIDALTLRMPLPESPGSPLCTTHSSLPEIDGLEIAMKGGQVGTDAYFSAIREGRASS